MPTIQCVYCKGKGTDPFFGTRGAPVKCIVCKGRKEISIAEGSVTCPNCKGNGKHRYYRMPCAFCNGTGRVTKSKAEGYKPEVHGEIM